MQTRGMTPLQAEIYNLAHESGAGGLTSHQLHEQSKLAADKTDSIKAVRALVDEGKLIGISAEGKRFYVCATAGHLKAIKADAERKKREKAIEKAEVDLAKQRTRSPSRPTPIKRSRDLVQLLEDQAENARVLLEKYLDDIDDPVLQSLINTVNELDLAVELARERAA